MISGGQPWGCEKMARCRECNVKVWRNAEYCQHCGVRYPAKGYLLTADDPEQPRTRIRVGPIQRALDVFASVIRWAIVLLIAAGFVWWLNLPESPEQKAAKARASAQEARANAQAMTIGQNTILRLQQSGWQPAWEAVQINTAEPYLYQFTIRYKYSPGSFEAVDADIRSVIHAALAEITRAGFVPPKIWVYTEQSVYGETGKPLLRVFGDAFYNPVTDQITYKQP